MARRPTPMTPADCDLRGLPFMPLHGERLIESDLFFESNGDEFKAAVALWWASWKQVPAASLPTSPKVLAGLARVSDAAKWEAVSKGALHGWVLCSDGRLYHPVVAGLALEAWDERQEHRGAREAEKERKRLEREERKRLFADLKAVSVHLPWNISMADLRSNHGANCPQPVRDLSAGQVQDRPAPVPAIEGTVEGTGIGTKEKNPQKPPEGAFSPIFDLAWEAFPLDGRATTNRALSWAAWQVEAQTFDEQTLLACIRAFAESLRGKGDRAKASPKFHVWLKTQRYDAFLPSSSGGGTPTAWAGPADVFSATEAATGTHWAVFHLSRCRWDAEARTLTAPKFNANMLEDRAGDALRAIGVRIQIEDERAA